MAYKVLYNLCIIQRYAYQLEKDRTPRGILHLHLTVLKFVVEFSTLFKKPKKLKKRKMFGTPYHSLVSHLPLLYRYISLRSVVAEQDERMFSDLR